MPAKGDTPWRLWGERLIDARLDQIEATVQERAATWSALTTLCCGPAGTESVRVLPARGQAAELGEDVFFADFDGLRLTFDLRPRGVMPLAGKLLVALDLVRL